MSADWPQWQKLAVGSSPGDYTEALEVASTRYGQRTVLGCLVRTTMIFPRRRNSAQIVCAVQWLPGVYLKDLQGVDLENEGQDGG